MSLVAFPSDVVFVGFSASLQVVQRLHASPFGGSEQAVDMLNDRWAFNVELAPAHHDAAARLEAFIAALRGSANHTELHHIVRPVPRGTISGSVTAQAVAQGASSIVLNATTGHTIKAGDLFGVDSLLLQAAADGIAEDGAVTVPLVNRVRRYIDAGAAVTLSHPTAPFRLVSAPPRVRYVAAYADAITLDFLEKVDGL